MNEHIKYPFFSLFKKDTRLLHIQSHSKHTDSCFQILLSKKEMIIDLGQAPNNIHYRFTKRSHPYSSSETNESKLAKQHLRKAFENVLNNHAYVVELS